VLDGTADKAMDNLEWVDLISEGGAIDEASSTTIVGYDRQSHGKEDLNKRTAENLRKYRVPPSFITNYGTLRKRKESLPGARIMWSKDDRDLDVISRPEEYTTFWREASVQEDVAGLDTTARRTTADAGDLRDDGVEAPPDMWLVYEEGDRATF
jgi:hypothetical protein